MMFVWETSIHMGVEEWMLDGDEVFGNFPCIWEEWNGC